MSDKVLKCRGNMKLYNGPLGKVFCGNDDNLKVIENKIEVGGKKSFVKHSLVKNVIIPKVKHFSNSKSSFSLRLSSSGPKLRLVGRNKFTNFDQNNSHKVPSPIFPNIYATTKHSHSNDIQRFSSVKKQMAKVPGDVPKEKTKKTGCENDARRTRTSDVKIAQCATGGECKDDIQVCSAAIGTTKPHHVFKFSSSEYSKMKPFSIIES